MAFKIKAVDDDGWTYILHLEEISVPGEKGQYWADPSVTVVKIVRKELVASDNKPE